MATIRDVARRAGVSSTLVSRVLNERKGVGPEARGRIMAAIRELSYRPNALARSLVLQRTDTIAVILDSLCVPFFFELITGLEAGADEESYHIVFSSGRGNLELKRTFVDYFTRNRSDGIIVYGSFHTDETLVREIAAAGFPFVLIENEIAGLAVNNVLIDNFGGAYQATEHLISQGFRRIVHFTGDMNVKVSLDRLNGYVRAMQDHRLAVGEGSIVHSDFPEESGHRAMKQLIEAGKVPEAVFFAADLTAFGAIRALREAGLSVPGDVAVVGFDDDRPESRDMVFPALTTVRQPLREIGKASVKLLARIIREPGRPVERLLFKTELVVRDSSRRTGMIAAGASTAVQHPRGA